MIATHSDIQQAVGTVSKYCANPLESHMTAAKRILQYLRGTKSFGLRYAPQGKQLISYADADFAGDLTDHHSTSGYCFVLASGLICWRSKKQSVIALSTANAEYVALSQATQEAIWLKQMFSEIGKDVTQWSSRMTRRLPLLWLETWFTMHGQSILMCGIS